MVVPTVGGRVNPPKRQLFVDATDLLMDKDEFADFVYDYPSGVAVLVNPTQCRRISEWTDGATTGPIVKLQSVFVSDLHMVSVVVGDKWAPEEIRVGGWGTTPDDPE